MATMKKDSYGSAKLVGVAPDNHKFPEVVSVILTFEEALKLNLAIDEALRGLNSYNRATKEGKSMGLNISVRPNIKRVMVVEQKI